MYVTKSVCTKTPFDCNSIFIMNVAKNANSTVDAKNADSAAKMM